MLVQTEYTVDHPTFHTSVLIPKTLLSEGKNTGKKHFASCRSHRHHPNPVLPSNGQRVLKQAVCFSPVLPVPVGPKVYHDLTTSPRWATDSEVLWYVREPSSDVELADRRDDFSSSDAQILPLRETCDSVYDMFNETWELPIKTIMLLHRKLSSDSLGSLTPTSEASDSWCDIYFQNTGGVRHTFWSCELIVGSPLYLHGLPTAMVLKHEQALSAMQWMVLPGVQVGKKGITRQRLLGLVAETILNNRLLRRSPSCIYFRYRLGSSEVTEWKGLCLHSSPNLVHDTAPKQCKTCWRLRSHGSWTHVLVPTMIISDSSLLLHYGGELLGFSGAEIIAHESDIPWALDHDLLLHVEVALFELHEESSERF